MANETSERRESFRVEDHIHLSCAVLAPAAARDLAERIDAENAACSRVAELRGLSAQMTGTLASIRRRDPEVAQYLAMLDRKIDTVAKMLEEQRLGADLAPNARVNIGAGGMHFRSRSDYPTGSTLDLRLLFFPFYLCIRALGRVVHSEPAAGSGEGAYRVGVEFSAMSEESRDALIRHLTERQAARLRGRNRG